MFFDSEINEVYTLVDKLFTLKAKREIKGTGIIFNRLLKATDLVKEIDFYILELEDYRIAFKNSESLYVQLIHYTQLKEKEAIDERNRLEYHRRHDMHFDDVTYDPIINELCYKEEKIPKFRNQLISLREKLKK